MKTNGLSLVFAGTPEISATILATIIAAKQHRIIQVITQPDKPSGRGRKLLPNAVKKLALQHHLPIYQPSTKQELSDNLNQQADLMLVVAYGMILPATALHVLPFGCINIHASLLPYWRGAAPVQRAIQQGDKQTGISLIQMDENLDTGDVLSQLPCTIMADDTAKTLLDRITDLATDNINELLHKIADKTLSPKPQQHELATYAKKIDKAERMINWHQPAINIERTIRAFNPSSVARTTLNGIDVSIWSAQVNPKNHSVIGEVVIADHTGIGVATADGTLMIKQLQKAGKRIVSAQDFLNANPMLNH